MPSVELRTYAYFAAVVNGGSVRAAADMCSVTQPAISKQIALLEETLGTNLFVRHRGGMMLTPAGAALHEEVVRLLHQADRTERSVAHWRGLGPGLRVAALDTTLFYVLAPFVAERGSVIADLRPARAGDLYRTLGENIDVAVGTARPPRGVHVEAVGRIPVSVQAAPDVAFGGGSVELGELVGRNLAISGQGSAVERVVRHAADKAGVDLLIANVVSSGRMAQASAASQGAIAITTEPPAFGLISYPLLSGGAPVDVTLFAVWERGHPANRVIREMVHELTEWFSVRRPWEGGDPR